MQYRAFLSVYYSKRKGETMSLLLNTVIFIIIATILICYLFFKHKYKQIKPEVKYINKSLNPKFLFTEQKNTTHYTLDIFPNQSETPYNFKIKVYNKKMEKTLKKEIYSINPSEEFFVVNCIDWLFTEDKANDLEKKYRGHVIYNGKDFSYEYLDRGTAQDQIS